MPTVCMPPPLPKSDATHQSEPLPVGNFRFLDKTEIENFSHDSIAAHSSIGYIIECDLRYPDHLHEAHNDYPMAPENLTVTKDMLSPYENLDQLFYVFCTFRQ